MKVVIESMERFVNDYEVKVYVCEDPYAFARSMFEDMRTNIFNGDDPEEYRFRERTDSLEIIRDNIVVFSYVIADLEVIGKVC